MKLVELLALELNEWPEDAHVAMQDPDQDHTIWFLEKNHNNIEFKGGSWTCYGSTFDIMISRPSCLAIDYETAIVGYDEWEDECKRISQPQAEEVEVNAYLGDSVKLEISHDGVNFSEIGTARIDNICDLGPAEPQWQQSAGPLAWRDTIIHCQAIIEDCEREIERNTQQLAAEGFELIALINSNLDKIDATLESAVDMGDWRNWKVGDVIQSISDDWVDITLDRQYTITATDKDGFTFFDDCGDKRELTPDGETMFEDGHIPDFEFVSRP